MKLTISLSNGTEQTYDCSSLTYNSNTLEIEAGENSVSIPDFSETVTTFKTTENG